MIVEVRTCARYSSIAQLVRTVCVPTSEGLTPSVFFPPMDLTEDRIVVRICVAVIRTSLFDFVSKNVFTVDCGVVPL